MDEVHLVADKLSRGADESDAHWKERVRRFITGGVFCETCGADLEQQAKAAGTVLDPLARYCGPKCDPAEVSSLPDEVVLCGIGYRTSAAEGTVIFTADAFHDRIVFERDPHDPLADLWYVEVHGRIPAGHVRDAYALVCAVFGGSFVKKGN